MSKNSLKKLMSLNKVFITPSKKRKNDDGTETQLYNCYQIKG